MQHFKILSALCFAGLLTTACSGGSDGGRSLPDFVTCDGNTCTLAGIIDRDYELDAAKAWQIDGVVQVGEGNVELASQAAVDAARAAGVTLMIPAGTHVKAFDDGVLLVTRGSRLIADGSASAPITFSSLDADFDGEGEWGGVVIQGFAPQYGKGNTGACFGSGTVCNVDGEGGTFVGKFGGNDPADDSGVLRYVRIAEGGRIAGPNNEVNGLTLQGVGHGTLIDYIQVHGNLDDGIEWFGGTVNVMHAVLTSNDDDDIDFDEGYQGNIQFAIVRKSATKTSPTGSNDPRAIEANSSDAEYAPQTEAAIANVTLVGGPVNNHIDTSTDPDTDKRQPGMRLRGAVATSIFNSALKGFDTGCIRIDHANTDGAPGADALSVVGLVNVLGECTDGFYDGSNSADPATNATASTVTLDAAYALTDPAASLGAATEISEVDNGSGFTFTDTDYVGAVEPGTGATSAWWAGWIIEGSL